MRCPLEDGLGGYPQANLRCLPALGRIEIIDWKAMSCKEDRCLRQARSRGWCTTHYRRWRSGEPMDTPIRSYVQVGVDENGLCVPATSAALKRRRKKPFAAEYALLAELGLGHG